MIKKIFNIKNIVYVVITMICCILFVVCYNIHDNSNINTSVKVAINEINVQNIKQIPEYSGQFIININDGNPNFDEEDFYSESSIKLSDVDDKGRVGIAFANLTYENMPSESDHRESVKNVYTTGWSDASYEIIPGNKLYNKSHLIAYSLIANCADEIYKNLFTGTHDLNTKGMAKYENDIQAYLKLNKDKHVLYRVTPVFDGDNLLVKGVQMEAESVEDRGESICYNVFIYNVQDGININYATGESSCK